MVPATGPQPEHLTNIDLIFLGVEYLTLPSVLRGVEFVSPSPDEVARIAKLLKRQVALADICVLSSEDERFPIMATFVSASENDWDFFRSPFEFRSHFHAEA